MKKASINIPVPLVFLISAALILLAVLVLVGFNMFQAASPADGVDRAVEGYEDGTYRGVFVDRDDVQVNIQFTLEDNVVQSIGYRRLSHRGIDYLEPEDQATEALLEQHQQILEHLEGRDIRYQLNSLYEPGQFVDDIDGFSGATIRANKVISAIRDALNRGVYVY